MNKLLMVDDDQDMLQLYQIVLDGEDFDVVTADNGADALTKAKSEQPQLILLDVMMPNMSGVEVLQKLKTEDATKDIPVVMFSNFADEKYMKDALSKGAAKYMVKTDYEPDELVKELKQILQPAKHTSDK